MSEEKEDINNWEDEEKEDDAPEEETPAPKLPHWHVCNTWYHLYNYSVDELKVQKLMNMKKKEDYSDAWPMVLIAMFIGIKQIKDSE